MKTRHYLTRNKLRMSSLLVVATLAFSVTVAVLVPTLKAQQNTNNGFNLVVTPVPLALEAKPGTSVSTDIKVKNGNTANERVKISVMKFGAEGEDGTPKLLDLEQGDEFAKWISFSENSFTAEPNVWKTIKVTVNVPQNAAFGYYYALVFSREGAEDNTQPQQANLLGAVASLLLLDVQAPGAKREAKLVNFSTTKKVYEFLPASFTVRMQNTGNTHVAPRGNIFISRGGNKLDILEVNFDKGYILPDSYRKFDTSWSNGSPVYKVVTADGKVVQDKNSKPKSSLSWDSFSPSKLRIGKYTANVIMVYNDGQGDVAVEGKVSFWVIPWRILGVLLVLLLLVGAGIYALAIRPLRQRLAKKK